MLFLRHHSDESSNAQPVPAGTAAIVERDALARAEDLCDRAANLHREAAEEAERMVALARSDAARLLREALAVIDEQVARSEAARRQQEMHEAVAQAARAEAERLLEQARVMRDRMAAVPVEAVDLTQAGGPSPLSAGGTADRGVGLRVLAGIAR